MVRAEIIRRAGWGLGDQALSSLTNFVLGLLVARNLGAESFGAFSLIFAVYLIVIGAARAILSEPLLVVYSDAGSREVRKAASAATGNAWLIGTVIAVLCLAAGTLAGGTAGTSLIALGVTLPGLVLQDTWRHVFFSARQPFRAFVNDLVWALLLIPAVVLAAEAGPRAAWAFVLAWGASGTIAGCVGLVQTRWSPRPSFQWWRDHRSLITRFFAEFVARNGSLQISFYAVSVFAGLVGLGALRGALILVGPLHVLYMGTQLVAVPEGVRVSKYSREKLRRMCQVIAVGLIVAPLAWVLGLLLAPQEIGRMLLGETWDYARPVLLPVGILMAGHGAATGAIVGLRAVADASRSLRARIYVSIATIASTAVFASTHGVSGAAWALAGAGLAGAIVFWRSFNSSLSAPQAGRDASVPPTIPLESEEASPW